jgi:hypothetical protein
MKFALLIYEKEGKPMTGAPTSKQMKQFAEIGAAYNAFTSSIQKAGAFVAGDGLQHSAGGSTVKVRNGKTTSTKGAADKKRTAQLTGYYIVEAKDTAHAAKLAAGIPGAKTGSIEVRGVISPT